MKKRGHLSGPAWAGFTMIELLVAMVVLSLLVLLLASMLDSSAKMWRENENRADAYREARAALNLIVSDLQTVMISTNTNYFSTNVVGSQPFGLEGSGLYFLTDLSADAQPGGKKGDLCAVGYYRRWVKQNSGLAGTSVQDPTKEGFQLYRTVYGSDLIYSNLLLPNAKPLTDLANPSSVEPEILARNICSLEFRFYQTNATNSAQRFSAWTNSTNNPMPQMIEVRMTAISDDLAKKLAGDKARWTTNDPLVKRNMRSFVSRVQIRAVSTNQP